MSDDLTFAAEFPAATRGQWLALVDRVLKGRPLETLTARTADDIAIEPLYARVAHDARIAMRQGRWQDLGAQAATALSASAAYEHRFYRRSAAVVVPALPVTVILAIPAIPVSTVTKTE